MDLNIMVCSGKIFMFSGVHKKGHQAKCHKAFANERKTGERVPPRKALSYFFISKCLIT